MPIARWEALQQLVFFNARCSKLLVHRTESVHSLALTLTHIRMAGKSQNIKLVWSKRAQHFHFILFSSTLILYSISGLIHKKKQQNRKMLYEKKHRKKKNEPYESTEALGEKWIHKMWKKKLLLLQCFFGGVLCRDDNIDRRSMSLRVTSAT